MRGLNLDHLRIFLDVVELGSFSAAADKHGLTQPAVSQQVRQLERCYGLRLLERVGRRVMPTAAGSELLGHIHAIVAAVEAAERCMQVHSTQIVGRIRLGTGATACTYLLPRLLADLRHRFPALEIVVSTGNTTDVLRSIEANTLDIGLVTLPVHGRKFQTTSVLEDAFVAIFPETGNWPAHITPQTLAELPLVLFEPGAHIRELVDAWFKAAGVRAHPVMELGSTEAMKEIVAAGLGCAILPGMAVPAGRGRHGLRVKPLAPGLSRTLAVVLRGDKPLHRGLAQLHAALLGLRTHLPAAPLLHEDECSR